MTDCQRLLDVLADGKYHSHSQLYGLGMIVHSRIADLRRKGHQIECRRETRWIGRRTETFYYYRLTPGQGHSSPGAPDALTLSPERVGSSSGGDPGALSGQDGSLRRVSEGDSALGESSCPESEQLELISCDPRPAWA